MGRGRYVANSHVCVMAMRLLVQSILRRSLRVCYEASAFCGRISANGINLNVGEHSDVGRSSHFLGMGAPLSPWPPLCGCASS